MSPSVHPLAPLLVAGVKLLCGAHGHWRGCEPAPRPRIYFANHSSHLDFMVIWSALPPALRARTRPVAAADYWRRGPVRRYLASRVFRAVLVERAAGDRAPGDLPEAERRARAQAVVEHTLAEMGGGSLILFPEGTRGFAADPGPFKSGLYFLARARPDVELVPAYLENLGRILPKGEFLPVPLLAGVTFGAPLALGTDEPRDAFLERARAAVIALREA